jgi:hypothetical protein
LVNKKDNEVGACCLTPNEQYEELGISMNSGKPYKNTNFDKEDILAYHKIMNDLLYIGYQNLRRINILPGIFPVHLLVQQKNYL